MAASREHQGLIISLIIFVMLTVIMSVACYALYNLDEAATAKVDTAEKNARDSEKKADEKQGKLNEIKKMLGFSDEDTSEAIKAKWEADMKVYEGVYPEDEGELDYSKLIARLAAEIRQLDDQIRTQAIDIGKRDVLLADAKKSHEGEMGVLKVEFERKAKDLAAMTLKYENQWTVYAGKQNDAVRLFTQNQQKASAAAKLTNAQLTQINEDYQREKRIADALKIQANRRDKVETEVADGRVTSTNQTTGRIYLDVGRADSLRPQITFSVHDQNVANVAGAKPKAKIIVTRLLSDPHMAEARVVEEDIANPIIRGDKIFSPAWSPGRQIRFAFAGTIDMDGDGRSDMKRIRDLVAINNGVVDAYPDANGDTVGKGITTNTRYLVVGEAKLKNAAAIEARSAAIDKARENGVEQLSVVEFLDMMGWRNPRQTIRLGRGAKGSKFAPRKSSDSTEGSFRPRRP